MPASVASSKRAETLPRRSSLDAVDMARNPRMLGMLAAAAAPSSTRVPPIATRFVVSPVRTTATAPKIGPYCITRWWPSRSESSPKIGLPTSSVA